VRVPWKLIGVAGLAGVTATGVVVARRRRSQREFDPDEVRSRLHRRLADVRDADEAAGGSVSDPAGRPGA
jgi:hypothetical protein